MRSVSRALLAAVALMALFGAPVLRPAAGTVQTPFVLLIVAVAGVAASVRVCRDEPDEPQHVTGRGSGGRDR